MAATMARRSLCSVANLSDHFSRLRVVLRNSDLYRNTSTSSKLLHSCTRSRSTLSNRFTCAQASQPLLQTQVSQPCSISPAVVGQSTIVQDKVNQLKSFHTSCLHRGLEEFFDDPKTYGEPTVKSGRPWSLDELRLKDNATLHKLWYVLLKEKNMLLTMEAEAERQERYMPGEDRLEKVDTSMDNLQQVLRERKEALTELKTGHREEHPGKMVYTAFGYLRYVKPREHYVPMYANKAYHRKRFRYKPFVKKYMRLWMEKELETRQRNKRRRDNEITKLKKRFPNADVWQDT